MAAAYGGMNLETHLSDTYPLLMDHLEVHPDNNHVVPIMMDNIHGISDEQKGSNLHTGSSSSSGNVGSNLSNGPSSFNENIVITIDLSTTSSVSAPHSITSLSDRSLVASSNSQLIAAASSSGRSTSVSRSSQILAATSSLRRSRSVGHDSGINNNASREQGCPGLLIAIDMAITLSQVIASIIVLSLSRNEKPRAPLALWILGYAVGCLASLPHLYWKYVHRRAQEQGREGQTLGSLTSEPSAQQHSTEHPDPSEGVLPISEGHQVLSRESRNAIFMEKFKISLDCFFAIWFVVGNVWIFGGHASSHEAPNLYRLCIVFLTFSCISYAMPFVICATVCCCLPCIITLLSYREDQAQPKGAAPAVIEGLPIYKFKIKDLSSKECKDVSDSDSDSPAEGGTFAPGTPKERFVSSEDAVCCICLGVYKDGVDLKELNCGHFFHADCLDKWLKINATCPLCKHELTNDDPLQQSRA